MDTSLIPTVRRQPARWGRSCGARTKVSLRSCSPRRPPRSLSRPFRTTRRRPSNLHTLDLPAHDQFVVWVRPSRRRMADSSTVSRRLGSRPNSGCIDRLVTAGPSPGQEFGIVTRSCPVRRRSDAMTAESIFIRRTGA